jgi:osmotically-inducible protein OsmY
MSLEQRRNQLSEDQELERDVRAELRNKGLGRRGLIGITVADGLVRLTGFTESYAEKWGIERAASQIVGVRDVRDYLEVRPSESDARTDGQIAAAARHRLEWDVRVPPGVGVEVTDGVVRLDGTVALFGQREAAEEVVRNLVGVRDVVNEIRLAHGAAPPDVPGDAEAAIRRRFGLACRRVWIIERSGIVTVSGAVGTLELLLELERVIEAVPGVLHVDNRLLVT